MVMTKCPLYFSSAAILSNQKRAAPTRPTAATIPAAPTEEPRRAPLEAVVVVEAAVVEEVPARLLEPVPVEAVEEATLVLLTLPLTALLPVLLPEVVVTDPTEVVLSQPNQYVVNLGISEKPNLAVAAEV